MTGYKLVQLAPGSYDVLLNGTILASLARNIAGRTTLWSAELLEALPPGQHPAPFTALEHRFATFEEARAWLGNPPVEGEGITPVRGDP